MKRRVQLRICRVYVLCVLCVSMKRRVQPSPPYDDTYYFVTFVSMKRRVQLPLRFGFPYLSPPSSFNEKKSATLWRRRLHRRALGGFNEKKSATASTILVVEGVAYKFQWKEECNPTTTRVGQTLKSVSMKRRVQLDCRRQLQEFH